MAGILAGSASFQTASADSPPVGSSTVASPSPAAMARGPGLRAKCAGASPICCGGFLTVAGRAVCSVLGFFVVSDWVLGARLVDLWLSFFRRFASSDWELGVIFWYVGV